MNNLRTILLLILTVGLLSIGGFIAWEAHRIEVSASRAFADIRPAVAKATASVDKVADGLSTLTDRVSGAATALDADAKQVAGKVDALVDHVDAAVQQTGNAVNKALGDVINPLPAAPSAPSMFSVFKPPPSPTPAPKKP